MYYKHRYSNVALQHLFKSSSYPLTGRKPLTWSKSLGVPNTNKAIVVHFSLWRKKTNQLLRISQHFILFYPHKADGLYCNTYADGGILIQLVFGSDTEACAVAAGGPGQVDPCLQLVAHLLVDGASKLSTIVTVNKIRNFSFKEVLDVLLLSCSKIFIHFFCLYIL